MSGPATSPIFRWRSAFFIWWRLSTGPAGRFWRGACRTRWIRAFASRRSTKLWRAIKYEEVHLKAYADGREARDGIGSWMNFYNHRRPHQAMNNQFPMAVWRAGVDRTEAAKTVDMPLRLDNANALPTHPQQTQKQQQEAA